MPSWLRRQDAEVVLQPHFASIENAIHYPRSEGRKADGTIVKRAQHKGSPMSTESPLRFSSVKRSSSTRSFILADELMRRDTERIAQYCGSRKGREVLEIGAREIETIASSEGFFENSAKSIRYLPCGFLIPDEARPYVQWPDS